MKIVYANKKTEKQCTDLKCATKLFGGNKVLAISLHARINVIEQLDENNRTYNPCNIDEISKIVKVVEIQEVSAHYE